MFKENSKICTKALRSNSAVLAPPSSKKIFNTSPVLQMRSTHRRVQLSVGSSPVSPLTPDLDVPLIFQKHQRLWNSSSRAQASLVSATFLITRERSACPGHDTGSHTYQRAGLCLVRNTRLKGQTSRKCLSLFLEEVLVMGKKRLGVGCQGQNLQQKLH